MYPRIARFRSADALRAHLAALGTALPLDDTILSAEDGSPMAMPLTIGGRTIGNRWCIHPMEGWDATTDGGPTETLLRRWRHFGISGAKLIWGGEAVAVVADGRANPRQLLAPTLGERGFRLLVDTVRSAHRKAHASDDDLVVALQLTHSGRFSQPSGGPRRPRIAFQHPLLDARHGTPDDPAAVFSDAEVDALIDAYVEAARHAAAAGFDMVDLKACHGYLVHEFLAARRRDGRYGGDFDGRTRLLTELVGRVREACPGLLIGVRLSLFDTLPWHSVDGRGEPWPWDGLTPYDCGFGVDDDDPSRIDLDEPFRLLARLHDMGVAAFNLTAGCPYAAPHVSRPAAYPPSDGYAPPEDPLVGVGRQIDAARQAKAAVPGAVMIGSAYTYLQDWLPHAAQAVVRRGWIDSVGLGRMVLSYPELPADTLAGRGLRPRRICRTFSDCTTAPRRGLRSGCYPLDDHYKTLEPDATAMKGIRRGATGSAGEPTPEADGP
jgi:2,4-dienoyl-CoA reductase-like NADH-dependent reductase (Old Yellow Enzyme family)